MPLSVNDVAGLPSTIIPPVQRLLTHTALKSSLLRGSEESSAERCPSLSSKITLGRPSAVWLIAYEALFPVK